MILRLLARDSLRRGRQPSLSLLTSRPLVTAQQKRALNEAQIKGEAANPTSSDSGGGSSNAAPIAITLGLGAAGAYYYYYTTSQRDGSSSDVTVDKSEVASSSLSMDDKAAAATPHNNKEDKEESEETAKSGRDKVDEEDGTSAGVGNRVTKIPASSKMQAGAAVAGGVTTQQEEEAEEHPEAGHRVTTLVPQQKNEPIDTSMTDAAIAALQSETTVATAKALVDSNNAVALSTIQELDSLEDVAQLKAKILQLSSELQDRTKWEAIRLKEFLVMKEKEVAEK